MIGREEVMERLRKDLDARVDEMCRVACGAIALRPGAGIYRIEKGGVINGVMMETMEARGYLARVKRKHTMRYYELTEKGRLAAMEDPLVRSTIMQERL
jgi:hypothetical protein